MKTQNLTKILMQQNITQFIEYIYLIRILVAEMRGEKNCTCREGRRRLLAAQHLRVLLLKDPNLLIRVHSDSGAH